MSRQHRRTWQRHETAVAAALGTTRTGTSAQNRRDGGADVRTGWLVAECKSWARLPARKRSVRRLPNSWPSPCYMA